MDISIDFKKSYFISGSECIIEPDPEHPCRWNEK